MVFTLVDAADDVGAKATTLVLQSLLSNASQLENGVDIRKAS